jgi:hypothetical protein
MRTDGGDGGQLDLRTGACLRSGKRFVDLPCGAQSVCITTRWGHRRQRQPFARLAGSRTLFSSNFHRRWNRFRQAERAAPSPSPANSGALGPPRAARRDHDHLERQRQRQRHRVLQRGSEQQRRKPLRHDGARRTFTVNQAGVASAPCTFMIDVASQHIAATGGAGTPIVVTAPVGCAWTAASNVQWITAARIGTVTIAGKTFTVTQAAAAPGSGLYLCDRSDERGGCGGRRNRLSSSDRWISVVRGLRRATRHGSPSPRAQPAPGTGRSATVSRPTPARRAAAQ